MGLSWTRVRFPPAPPNENNNFDTISIKVFFFIRCKNDIFVLIFALLVGVRVMWLSMKTLRPEYSATPQQNTKKIVKTVEAKESKFS